MDQVPQTRPSLLIRLRDRDDAQAWGQFADIYGPLIYRFGRYQGLQDADAADLVQETLCAVVRAADEFEYDPSRGTFRSWLLTIARHKLSDRDRARFRLARGSGDTAALKLLQQQSAPAEADEGWWDQEYQKRIFEWAAEQVRTRVTVSTWTAFRRTAIDGEPARVVAEELGMSTAAVYLAKGRVLGMLKEEVKQLHPE